jgi:transcriptional regulator with XRE-family HTH domain
MNKSRSVISHWELSRRSPDLDELLWLARFFGVSSSYLLGETDDRKCGIYKETIGGHDYEIKYLTEGYPDGLDHEEAVRILNKLKSAGIDIKALR